MPTDLRNLPDPVRERLGAFLDDRGDAPLRRGFDTVDRGRLVEARVGRVEVRAADNGDPIVDGYATVYDTWYDVAGGAPYGWSEMFAAGACRKAVMERQDTRLLFDHDGIPLARTKPGTLVLDDDELGLHFTTPGGIDVGRNVFASAMASAMDRGDLDECSLAFRVIRQEWNDDYTERIIREVQLFDVSVVTYPANPATVAQLRGARSEHTLPEPADTGLISLDFARGAARR